MKKLSTYFTSFNGFMRLLISVQRRLQLSYYKFFVSSVRKEIRQQFKTKGFDESIDSLFNQLLDYQEIDFGLIDELEKKNIIHFADQTISGVYNLLGSGDVKLQRIGWHTDFKTGFAWPKGTFYLDYVQENISGSSDVKVPRELSRSHHLLKLALAYNLTKDSKYAGEVVNQICDWINDNPLMYSINWGCTMDVAIRAVNWVYAIALLRDYPIDQKTQKKILISLYEHGWFIYRNPEKRLLNNHNHYLADLAGQIILGLAFRHHFPEAKKWLQEGVKELFLEMRIQVLPTGMSYERSTNYNRLVIELLLVPFLVLKHNGFEIPSDIWYRLEKMFEFVMYSSKPDGTSPVIGDQDNGRMLPFGVEDLLDFTYLLSLGAVLFNRTDFKKSGNGFNVYCLIFGGRDAKKTFDALKPQIEAITSRAFPDTGFYIMRKEDHYLMFNISGKGLYPDLTLGGTHTHSDLLSFELFAGGRSFLVDPGSYVYTANAELRQLFRSTSMHNTATVDAKSQNEIKRDVLWDFERNAVPELLLWQSTDHSDRIVARHQGYMRLDEGVIHTREIIFDKRELIWNFRDSFGGKGKHLINLYFHFDTNVDFEIENGRVYTKFNSHNLEVNFENPEYLLFKKDYSWVSKSYGTKESACVLNIEVETNMPFEQNYSIRLIP